MNKCHPIALGVSLGILWSVYVVFIGITAMFGWGNALLLTISSLYIGYGASVIGIIIGALWAFTDGFIAGVVIAWIYNQIAK